MESELNGKEVVVDNVKITLMNEDFTDYEWIGQHESVRLLTAAWLKSHQKDRFMTPVLVGPPGSGKTALACTVAKKFDLPTYIMNCTSDMKPEDLLVMPVLNEDQSIRYQASSLLSAMVRGGVCILDEANRMSEKSGASLASLLDDRRYIRSVSAGVKVAAHPDFRIVATMNEDSSTFSIPEYIESRLKPILPVEFPTTDELKQIIGINLPFVDDTLIMAVISFLEEQREQRLISGYSVRNAIEITRLKHKLESRQGIQEPIENVARFVIAMRSPSLRISSVQWV